ncbi:MAG: MFS transporter [Geminicoccaceae bacterium]
MLLACMVGNALEWYDFAIYGYLATAIGAAFFPAADPVASTLAAFGAFAAGFVARPLGGILFGHVGDRLGRKPALLLSIVLMAVPTVLIGLLPTHASIGAAAAVLLVILRVLQGLSVGGEYTTSIVYVVEHAEPAHRARMGSMVMVGGVAGMLMGSGVAALVANLLGADAFAAWGWRVPFLLGLPLAVMGLALRRRLPELPHGTGTAGERAPLVEALRSEGPAIGRGILLCLSCGPVFYLLFVYVVSYLRLEQHLPEAQALDLSTAGMVVILVAVALGGVLADLFGRRPVGLVSMGLLLVLAWPIWASFTAASFVTLLAGQLLLAALIGLYAGQIGATLVESLPRRVRCTAIALSYNISVGLFGGFSPMVATWLVRRTGDDMLPAVLAMIVAAGSLAGSWLTRETRGQPLR